MRNMVETYAAESIGAAGHYADHLAAHGAGGVHSQIVHLRDQNIAAIIDTLTSWGLDPGDPAIIQGALAGLMFAAQTVRDHEHVELHLELASFTMTADALCVMVNRQAGAR
jgi:hypothetical protein